jgi:hypothetical protein
MFLGTFFTITASDTSAMISQGASLVSDFMPLLIVLIGILVGALIIRMIARLF